MSLEQLNKKKGFYLEWKNTAPTPTAPATDYFKMRNWQLHAFNLLKSAPFVILNAPMGSGKSWLMCLLSAFKMKNDNFLRSIIVVPQTIIASGFTDAKLQMPDGENIHWQIKHNLCKEEHCKGTVNHFIKWLEEPSNIFCERSILCTHATLVAVYKKLKVENRLNLLKNILLWIDEAHHVKNVTIEGLDGTIISNGIGELVAYLLDNSSANVNIGLTTASFFRGDRTSLLTNEMEAKFKRFNLPYDEYLKSMEHLKSFSFDFLLSGHSYTKGIELLVQDRKGKDIIYIPHPISQYSTGDKYQEVSDIIHTYGDILYTTKEGVIIVQGEAGEQKILDLVNETQRKQKKSYLENPIVKKQRDSLDAIIAMSMFKEGANWIYADRSIIVGARSSLVDVIQMVGRLFRDAEGKGHVEVIQLLPFSLDQRGEADFCENLNNYLKAIYASLILENILSPVKIKNLQSVASKKSEEEDVCTKANWLGMALPDDAKQLSLIEDVSNSLIEIIDVNKEASLDTRILYDEYKKIIPQILDHYAINQHKDEIAKQIWGTLVRRSMQMQGLDVENIDFNLIQKTNPLGFLLRYTSGACNINTFEKLREVIQLSRIMWRPFSDAREFVRSLNIKNVKEWQIWSKSIDRPKDIPSAPDLTYSDQGWISWGDWLGTNVIATQKIKYLPFTKAREYAHSLKLKNRTMWEMLSRNNLLPQNIPAHPDRTYKNKGWINWGNFLGTGTIAYKNRMLKSFEEAREFARNLGLKNQVAWFAYAKTEALPKDIPACPNEAYADNGWISFGDWLGTGRIASQNCTYRSFEDAKLFVSAIGLKSNKEWRVWSKGGVKPQDIPAAPDKIYANQGWEGWGDFLGTETIAYKDKVFKSFEQAKIFTKALKFKSRMEWYNWIKSGEIPYDIPTNPSKAYKNDGWLGWGDFLGTGNVANFEKKFRPFNEARLFARSLLLRGKEDWAKWSKTKARPIDIPTAPSRTYANRGWNGWKDWLGTKKIK